MKAVYRVAPVILVGSFIFLTSQLLSAPQTSPWFSVYIKLDTVAHLILYFSLGFFVCRSLALGLEIHPVLALALAASISVTFGIADEFHQMYIPGRSAEFGDLLADLGGAMLGGSLYLALSGLTRWCRDFLASSEITWPRVLLRAAVVGGVAAAICAPAVVYADSIVRVWQALLHEGTLQAQQAVNRYIIPPHQQPRISEYKIVLSHPAHRSTAKSQANHPELNPAPPPSVQGQPGAVQVSPRPVRLAKEIAVQGAPKNQGLEGDRQATADLEHQLLDEMKHIMTRLNQLESARKAGISSAATRGKNLDEVSKTAHAIGTLRDKITQSLAARHIAAKPGVRTITRQALGEGTNAPSPCDLIAIITSNTNPVDELTLDQVRKIFSGEYTNWRQVGGPDIPVKVVTVRKQTGELERKIKDRLGAPLSSHAVRLPLVSLIVPVVAQTQGAVGFLPVLNTEQLDFVLRHKAFKRIAVKADNRSPAFEPGRTALNSSEYPLMKKTSVRRTVAAGAPGVAPSGVALR